MSKPKGFEKPSGFKDYLPDAAARLRKIENDVLACMERWGYREIMTPTLEFYDTVGAAGTTEDSKLFKLLDKRGTTIVLRSDLTAPIARVTASLLKDAPLPLRLSYHANVFRAIEEEAGRQSEFFQAGAELVGDGSPEADAEVIAMAVAALEAAGVERFKVSIGHVGLLNGLFREVLQAPDREELKLYLLNRNYVGYRQYIEQLVLPPADRKKLEDLLRLRGGRSICGEAEALTDDAAARDALTHLCRVWDTLEDYGVSEHVVIDLTMIGDFAYYTGLIFEGYAEGLGFPVCSGGRYDNLLQQFGRPAPATGFALKTNRILEALEDKRVVPPYRILIRYDEQGRKEALLEARRLRTEGLKDLGRLAVVTAKVDAADVARHDIHPADDSAGEPAFDRILTYAAGEVHTVE